MSLAPGQFRQVLYDPNAAQWQLLSFGHLTRLFHLLWTIWWVGLALRLYISWRNRHPERRDLLSQQNPHAARAVRRKDRR